MKTKKQGRNTKFPEEMLREAAELYLESNLSAKEVGEKYNISAEVVRYHAKKLRERGNEKV